MTAPRFTGLLLAGLIASCTRAAGPVREGVDLVVIAPHPDDEALIAGGVLQRALREGRRAAVVLMSNGDKGCGRDGFQRAAETVAALGALGLPESDIHFLGYPDGYLASLGARPLQAVPRRDREGRCVTGATTYPARGTKRLAEHVARTGEPAPYTAQALEEDLASLLARLQPRDVYLPHPIDSHPDHAATYGYFRRALDHLAVAPRVVHRAVVHAEGCWPATDCGHFFTPDLPIGSLPPPLSAFRLTEQLPVDARHKLEVLALYRSQIGPDPASNWLAAFARPFEPFAPERLVRGPMGWVRQPAPGVTPTELRLDLAPVGPTALTAFGPGGTEELALVQGEGALELSRIGPGARERLGAWAPPGGVLAQVRVRIDPRPDDGGLTELTVYGPDGFIGEVLLPALFLRAEPGPAPVVAGSPEGAPTAAAPSTRSGG